MKTIYFLRHGQTVLNSKGVHQFPDTPLSLKGKEQAMHAAKYFTDVIKDVNNDVDIDLIIASPLARTLQTAQPIIEKLGTPMETSDLFVELRRPKMLWGKSWASPRSLWIMGLLYLFAGRQEWHYSDEENLEEFHARSRRALEYLAKRPEQNILVVTHRGFMAGLVERMRRDGMDSVSQYRRALWKNLLIKNGCFIKATWTPEGENGDTLTGTWKVEGGAVCPSK